MSTINSPSEITLVQENNDHTPATTAVVSVPPAAAAATTNTNSTATRAGSETEKKTRKLMKFIKGDIDYIKETAEKLYKYKTEVEGRVKNASIKLERFKPAIENLTKTSVLEDPPQSEENIEDDLRKLKKSVRKLKLPIAATKFHIDYAALNKDLNLCFSDSTQDKSDDLTNEEKDIIKVPNLYTSKLFERSSAFKDFKAAFDDLEEIRLKLCLLCFSVFPEGAIIKKRLMIYWWIAEGFVNEEGETSAEEIGGKYFNLLITKGFIKPVDDKKWQLGQAGSCKMDPLTRFGVIKLADRVKMFDFDSSGSPKEDFSSSFRACLLGKGLVNIPYLDKLHMIFNVNENILEFNQGWFSKMKNANIIYLGRWKASGRHHVEVEDSDFLEELQFLKHLKFLSFQGVSRITELPESISKLDELIILDLRACHNLERVPKGIGALKNLTHLDMWESYLLDHMPKELSSLENLQVLKGFVVGDSKARTSCTLEDLAKLEKLKKLSIIAKVKSFPEKEDLIAFSQFKALLKLTIAWGGGSSRNESDKSKRMLTNRSLSRQKATLRSLIARDKAIVPVGFPMLPENLEKLDLQCYPEVFVPDWLQKGHLQKLKKLYIRGGQLRYLRIRKEGIVNDEWNVEILRLKYLSDLEMDWNGLNKLFPKLIYLEKVKCPKLTLFPCDQYGVWMKKMNHGN